MNLRSIISSALVGAFSTVMGLVLLYYLGQFVELACERKRVVQVFCVKTTHVLGILTINVQTIERIEQAWVHEKCDEDGCSYRVVLRAARGNFPLSSYRSSEYASEKRIADQINDFINDLTKPSFEINTNSIITGLLLPLAFVFAGPFIAFRGIMDATR